MSRMLIATFLNTSKIFDFLSSKGTQSEEIRAGFAIARVHELETVCTLAGIG